MFDKRGEWKDWKGWRFCIFCVLLSPIFWFWALVAGVFGVYLYLAVLLLSSTYRWACL